MCSINKKTFFENIRGFFGGRLTAGQVQNMEFIIDQFFKAGLCDLRWLAYMLATVRRECGADMAPIREVGKGQGKAYGKVINGNVYYGRGYVQLTWYWNYQTMSKLLGIDLYNDPDLALKQDVAAKIMIEGMTKGKSLKGDFTGVSLENFFNDQKTDWVNARKIINGLDKAELIEGYAKQFYSALTKV